jgi:RNA polymerase sigma-70 factor (ECF subfamily)
MVPEDFRIALILCDLYGFGHAQAAEILGVPVGTVKSRVFRGRLALGGQLAEREGRGAGSGTQASVATSESVEAVRHDHEE